MRNENLHHADLDHAISSVLNSNLLERGKQLQYEQALTRNRTDLLTFEFGANKPVKVRLIPEEKDIKEKMSEAVPREEKEKALQIYDYLNAFSSLTSDKKGQLILDGAVIENSNLVDLIAHEMFTKRKKKRPLITWEVFTSAKKKTDDVKIVSNMTHPQQRKNTM